MTKRLYSAEKLLEAVLADVDDDHDYDDRSWKALTSFQTWNWMKMMLPPPRSPLPSSPPPPSPLPSSPPSLSTPPPLSPPSHASPAGSSHPSPSSSTPDSPPQPATWTSTLKPVEVKQFNSPHQSVQQQPFLSPPREVFEMFFSDGLMKLMVTESNRYAEEVMGNEKFATWTKMKWRPFWGSWSSWE